MLNFDTARDEFPLTRNGIFLNHAAAGPIPLRARDAVAELLTDHAQQAAMNHADWLQRHNEIRRGVANLVNGDEQRVAFVQNTSSGLSIAANGIRWVAGDNVVVPDCEFPSNTYPWMNLSRLGVELRRVGSARGYATLEDIASAIDDRTRAVSVSFVQFSNGHRYDLAAIGELCRNQGSLFVVDGTQGVGALQLDAQACGIDWLAVSGHKWMLSPFGIGFVHASQRALDELNVTVVGWLSVNEPFKFRYELDLPHDATRFEAGTENAAGIVGLGASLELMAELGFARIENQVLDLTEHLCDRLKASDYELQTSRHAHSRSGIVVFRSARTDTEALFARLEANNVACSVRNGGIRLSPHYYNNESEIDAVIDILNC